MNMRKTFFILVILMLWATGYSSPTWIRTYNYGPISSLVSIDNGSTVFAAAQGPVLNLVRVDDAGDILWEKEYSGTPFGLACLPSSSLMLMYKSSGILTLTAVSYLGDELWTAQAPLDTGFKGLVETSDGCCVYLTGDSLVKVNSDGSLKWTAYIADVVENASIINSSAGVYGGVALAGEDICYSPSYVWLQAAVADSAGTIVWSGADYYMYCEYCEVTDVFGNSNGGCYAAGLFGSNFPPPMSNEATFSVLPGGETDWKKKTDDVICICESADGNAVIAGYSIIAGSNEIFIRKMNHSTGSFIWQHSHGFPVTSETCSSIALCEDGGFVIGGFSSPNSLLLRIDSQGLIDGMGTGGETENGCLQISPESNPCSSGSVLLRVQAPGASSLDVFIYDAAGRLMSALKACPLNGTEMVNAGILPTGMYTAHAVSAELGGASCRLVVLN